MVRICFRDLGGEKRCVDAGPMSHDIQELWRARLDDQRYNTSYPLKPAHWQQYRSESPLPFREAMMSFYLHIPFCAALCSFCEYTRMKVPAPGLQRFYLNRAADDMRRFVQEHPYVVLQGFDIGGGTPMVLEMGAFVQMLELYSEMAGSLSHTEDYEPSIEGTFRSLTEERVLAVHHAGINRLSLGLQSTSERVLGSNGRTEIPISHLGEKVSMAHSCGIRTINIDLMYGLRGQTPEDIEADLSQVECLGVEQVTLYELRTNMLPVSTSSNADERFNAYCRLYEGLRGLGYCAQFGQNTFSRCKGKVGCSSYIKHRMLEGAAYKGFGISAQSMSEAGISYNKGKNAAVLPIQDSGYDGGDTYLLPPRELAAKYIAVSAYNGRMNMDVLSAKLGMPAEEIYADQLEFCLGRGLMERSGSVLAVTREGFRHYGALFSLFYSPKS